MREQGWSLVDGELEPGLRSIAAPLHARDGRVVAALNVSTSATRDSVEHVRDAYLPPLLRTAAAIDAEVRRIIGDSHADALRLLRAHRRELDALVVALLERLRGQGARRVSLEVRSRNAPAIALYRSLGFENEGVRPKYYRDGEDALVLGAAL